MKIVEILSAIQSQLAVPKSQLNTFGKYKYRSCEDIIEAVKPLVAKHNGSLVISDEIVQLGDRYYVKATSTLTVGDEAASATAYAREPETKKGMDEAQITGATSSYARKYSLNGLLAIDDTKDADTQDNREPKKAAPEKKVEPDLDALTALGDATDMSELQAVWKSLSHAQRESVGKDRLAQYKQKVA